MGRLALARGKGPPVSSDTTPNAFTFTDLTGQTESTAVTGSPVTITGINASTSFSVTGGSVQINGAGSFVTSGSVVNNDTLTPKGTANASYLGTTNVVVTVGGISDTFTITTRADPSGSYSLGVTAASLEYVVDQKTDGTVGLSGSQTNTSTGYLTGLGAQIDYLASSVYFTAAAVVENVDFAALGKPVYADTPAGAVVEFINCKFDNVAVLWTCSRPGGNTGTQTGGEITVRNCLLDGACFNMAEGGFVKAYNTMMKNSPSSQYFFAGIGSTKKRIELYNCVQTMSTQVPSPGTHMEFIQIGGDPTGYIHAEDCLFDVEDTVGTAYDEEWTGVHSVGVPTTWTNCVWKGIKQVNDWTLATNPPSQRVNCSIAYNDPYAPSLTNCVMGQGDVGRVFRQTAGSSAPDPAGGVYDYDTGALLSPVN